MQKVASVEEFIIKHEKWQDELILLHELFVATGLEESIKWGTPVYTWNNKNIVGVGSFKNHFAIWFFQGVFLEDKHKLLINASEASKAFRQMRFKSMSEINEEIITEYTLEAIKNQKAGKEVKPQRIKEIIIPDELEKAFQEDPEIKQRFLEFSNKKQYEFCRYISQAKREETRLKRLDKCIPLIFDGVGIFDKYNRK